MSVDGHGAQGHRHAAHRDAGETAAGSIGVALLTVSDSRNASTDRSGDLAASLIERAGQRVAERAIVPDEPARVRETVLRWAGEPAIDAIVVNGGTGVSARDRTVEAVDELFERRLDGFGELFRMLSWEQVGSAAMLSRAVAGIVRTRPVFLLPGSPKAVELGLSRLILPELAHLIHELSR